MRPSPAEAYSDLPPADRRPRCEPRSAWPRSAAFRDILKNADAEPLLLPLRSPDLNSYIERFFRSLKSECLSRLIFFGEKSLRRAVTSYLEHFHTERNHQGLDNGIIDPGEEVGAIAGKVECRERLGGLLRYYRRAA